MQIGSGRTVVLTVTVGGFFNRYGGWIFYRYVAPNSGEEIAPSLKRAHTHTTMIGI